MASNPDPEDWYISCSDDEKYSSTGCPKGKLVWAPRPEEKIRIFQSLEKDGVDGFPFDWKCLNGRRPRTPESESGEDESDDEEIEGNDRQSRLAVDTSNFDFDADDDNDAPTTTPRRAPNRELKGSARKKTTELSNILVKMERNRLNDVREKAAAASKAKQQ